MNTQKTNSFYDRELSRHHSEGRRLLTVAETSRQYNVSKTSLYNLIRSDPHFPSVNLGLKKRFYIDEGKFEEWYRLRSKKQKLTHLSIPTTVELLEYR